MGKENPEMGTVLAVGEGRITPDGAIVKNRLKIHIRKSTFKQNPYILH